MALLKLRKSMPTWFLNGTRANDRDLFAVQDRIYEDDEVDWDWRWVDVPVSDLIGDMGADLNDYIDTRLEGYEDDVEKCDSIAEDMRATGPDKWLAKHPIIFCIYSDTRDISIYSGLHALGVAHHVFGLKHFRARCADGFVAPPSQDSRSEVEGVGVVERSRSGQQWSALRARLLTERRPVQAGIPRDRRGDRRRAAVA